VDFENYCYIMWHYRGQFKSTPPQKPNAMTPEDHARDVTCILDDLGIEVADVLIGWSIGVQVCLSFALVYPHRVKKLALLNGMPGRALSSILTPLGENNAISRVTRFVTLTVLNTLQLLLFGDRYSTSARFLTPAILELTKWRLWRLKHFMRYWCWVLSVLYCQRRISVWTVQYMLDAVSYGESHTRHWLEMLYCMEDHDVSADLHKIHHPVLLLTGQLDIFTPSHGMYKMHRDLPNSRLVVRPYGGHFLLWEYPQWVLLNLVSFCSRDPDGYKSVEATTKRRPGWGRVPRRQESDYAADEADI